MRDPGAQTSQVLRASKQASPAGLLALAALLAVAILGYVIWRNGPPTMTVGSADQRSAEISALGALAARLDAHDDALRSLAQIARDSTAVSLRSQTLLETLLPQHAAAIKALEDRMRAIETRQR